MQLRDVTDYTIVADARTRVEQSLHLVLILIILHFIHPRNHLLLWPGKLIFSAIINIEVSLIALLFQFSYRRRIPGIVLVV